MLIVDDPDAPSGTFTHWVLFDIPGTTLSLTEAQKAGGGVGVSGKNDFSKTGYGGPCPPRGTPWGTRCRPKRRSAARERPETCAAIYREVLAAQGRNQRG